MRIVNHSHRELLRCTPAQCRRASAAIRIRAGNMAVPLAGAAFLMLLTLLGPRMVSGQGSTTEQTHAAQSSAAHPAAAKAAVHDSHPGQRRTAAAHGRTAVRRRETERHAKPAAVAVAAPPVPPKPNWPVNQPPEPAKISWDSQGLTIDASNSSLDQILHEVAVDTGAKVQGLDEDQRIFGTYGPGPARAVLSNLLDGSGYNVLMIGGRGDEPPQQIILSKSAPGTPQPANAQQAQTSDVEQGNGDNPQVDNPLRPFPDRGPFGMAGRTPQQVQQQMMMREQQAREQQVREQEQQEQEQQQDQPQNNPQY